MIFVYAIGALAVLAAVGAVVLFRRSDNDLATGSLAQSTNDRDVIVKPKSEMEGRDFESAALDARTTELAPPKETGPVVFTPPSEQALGESRRQFLNRGIVGAFAFSLGAIGVGALANFWPNASGGFGGKIAVGNVEQIKKSIRDNGGFFYFPLGRMWITEYPAAAVQKASEQYGFYDQVSGGLEAGVVALFQTCPHLGCRVPECSTSQWFECPCHGSQYNRVGEKKGGPAPRGMDRFPMEVSNDGKLTVDTGKVIQGPPIGVNTTGQEAEGPNCLSSGGSAH